MTESDQISTMTLRDYWRVVWLRRGWVIAIVVICTLLAYGKQATQSPTYVASARLMYAPPPNVANGVVGNSTTFAPQRRGPECRQHRGHPRSETARVEALGQHSEPISSISAIPCPGDSSGTVVATVVDVTAEAGSAGSRRENRECLRGGHHRAAQGARAAGLARRAADHPGAARPLQDAGVQADRRVRGTESAARNLQISEASANGDFAIIVPATPPASPTSPKPMKWAVFGFIAGLFLGVVVAFVVSQFDTHVRSHGRGGGTPQDAPIWPN